MNHQILIDPDPFHPGAEVVLPPIFEARITDDSLQARAPIGSVVKLNTLDGSDVADLSAGDGVLVKTASGQYSVRIYRPQGDGTYLAEATNPSCQPLHSVDDGLSILAVVVGVPYLHWCDIIDPDTCQQDGGRAPTVITPKLNTSLAASALAELSFITKHMQALTSAPGFADESFAFLAKSMLSRIDDINDVVSEYFDPQEGLTNLQIFKAIERRSPTEADLKWCPELKDEGAMSS